MAVAVTKGQEKQGTPADEAATRWDIICLSHLRWDFVYQRPQHLLGRATREHRVFFFEEPIIEPVAPYLKVKQAQANLWVTVPHFADGLSQEEMDRLRVNMLDQLIEEHGIERYILWYYTPSPIRFTRQLEPLVVVYDSMDELSAFKNANPALRAWENELLERADIVFSGGQSLYEAKQGRHPNVHLFPSSIDQAHFGQARSGLPEPKDQAGIAHPRLGYFGVIDERLDLGLVAGLAGARPEWQIVLVGPVAKVKEEDLPRRPNIHYLDSKPYAQLPAYLAGWDVALMPFAHNESTRFISPTKTPEYLAGGKPVVSTSIRDVVRPYGEQGLVRIADNLDDFVGAVESLLAEDAGARQEWLMRVDRLLAENSWDITWARMQGLIEENLIHPVF